jgi:hypothetical protein
LTTYLKVLIVAQAVVSKVLSKGKVESARRLQLRLEIATLPSYMSSVDLDPFGQLSVFLIECRAKFPHPSKFDRCPRRSAHRGCVATRQFLE